MSTFSHPITRVKLDPSGKVLALSRGPLLSFFNVETSSTIPTEGEQHTATVRSIEFSNNEMFAITGADDKQVKVWVRSPNAWKNVATIKTPKKITTAEFAKDMKTIVFADKLGDVLHIPITVSGDQVSVASEPPQIIIGHYSSISTMTLSTNGKYVITGDKDEHIRVSNYPNGFDIESFCLGHTEFISGLLVSAKHPDVLISGCGDGSLKLWELSSGKLLDSVFVGDNKDKKSEDADTVVPFDIHESTQTIIVGIEEKPVAYVASLADNKLVIKDTIALKAPIGSATFDSNGNIMVSYLPVNFLHEQMAQDSANQASSSSSSSTPTPTPTPAPSTPVSIPESKLALLVQEGGHYVEKSDSPLISAINKSFVDTVAKEEYLTRLHEYSRNFQFRKRFGGGEFSMGNNYHASGDSKSNKKDKKAKVDTTEKKEKNDPITPNFVQ